MTVPTVGAGNDPFAEYRAEALQPKTRELNQEMNKELFLELLVASVKYQDPSEPMKTQEMVQQTTALSQMEQMLAVTKITKQQYELSQRTAAASLVGAEVTYVTNGTTMSGVVQAVRVAGEDLMLDIGGNEVKLGDVTRVGLPGGQLGTPAGAQPAPQQPAPAAGTGTTADATAGAPAAADTADAADAAAATDTPAAADTTDTTAPATETPEPEGVDADTYI